MPEMPRTAWLSEVYQQFRREMFLTAWTVLRRADLAEDAVHSAFVKMVSLGAPPIEPKLYVFRCVRNAAIDLAKVRSRRREEPLSPEFDQPSSAADSFGTEEIRFVAEALERLDESSREVIELHLHAALTFREIAHMLNEPLPTIAARYRRALDNLGKEVKVRYE